MNNKKKQKYINIIIYLGVAFILYPFFGIYTFDKAWDMSFMSILFSSGGLFSYGKYIPLGLIILALGVFLDLKNEIE